MERVLIVEDQDRVAKALAVLLELEGISSVTARSPEAAVAALRSGGFDLVLQDMNFTAGATSGEEGTRLFRRLRELSPDVPILLLTAWAHLESAVQLVRAGAADYVEKPWNEAKLLASIRAALERSGPDPRRRAPDGEAPRSARPLARGVDLCGLVYASTAMHELVALAARVADSEVPVLVTGESGTGKEKIAEIVHANSRRRARAFVKFDAGALPETLLEAELFGAEAGAFTGATRRRVGRFEAANGGTLLLDEIGNLSLAGQVKLLRVLQTGEMARLGSSQPIAVDVRIVAATNSDLSRSIAAGAFREDLYYRLAVIELEVPPLAKRVADVLPLAESFLLENARAGDPAPPLGEAAREALRRHDWPGNVRELKNRIQRAALLSRGLEIGPAELGLGSEGAAGSADRSSELALLADSGGERRRVEAALLEAGGVVAKAADSLGLSRQALYRKMERLGIVLERRLRS